jgi:hypothetical protein
MRRIFAVLRRGLRGLLGLIRWRSLHGLSVLATQIPTMPLGAVLNTIIPMLALRSILTRLGKAFGGIRDVAGHNQGGASKNTGNDARRDLRGTVGHQRLHSTLRNA